MHGVSDRPAGPLGGQVACSACGSPLDPLRAGHVAIFDSSFHYFCNRSVCRASFVGDKPTSVTHTPRAQGEPAAGIAALLPPVRQASRSTPDETVPERIIVDDKHDLLEPMPGAPAEQRALAEPSGERRDVGLLLVALTLIAGCLAMALELAAASRLVLAARVVLLAVGSAALVGRAVTGGADRSEPHWLVAALAPCLATLVAGWALLLGDAPLTARASFLAGAVLTVAAINLWLLGFARRAVDAGRRWVALRLDVAGRRVADEPTALNSKELVYDIRPGEHVVVEVDETVPVDLEIIEGEVEVLSWLAAATRVRRGVGDVVVAGSRVTHGQLRGVCTWAGDERALARPLLAEARRSDVHADLARMARRLAERWAPLFAAAGGVMFGLLGWSALEIGMVVVAVYAAFATVTLGALPGLTIAGGVRTALGRGVIYNSPEAWERCTRVTSAIFCARGTLLRGEPELVEMEVFASPRAHTDSSEQVLSLAAGVLASERHPVAVALRRAARDRGVAPEPVRTRRAIEGIDVTAVSATGDALCVGSRALMMDRKISVAAAEQNIYQLESGGRTVVLVAKAGRLVGLLALQDGLRTGARAAVQHLLDAKIEPVLMSADTRETCEALGRALDIDHLRVEIGSDERAQAVERIRDTGGVVAVLGHTPYDDAALAAADASVALSAAGRGRDDFSVWLVSDDVRDATLALALAHRTRAQATWVMLLCVAPAAFGALVVAAGFLPAVYAPLAQLLGTLAAVGHVRSYQKQG